jgi:hypothetical protein
MDENDKVVQVFDQQKPNRPWYKLEDAAIAAIIYR